MLDDTAVKKISFGTTVIGIALLLIIQILFEPPEKSIVEISSANSGESIVLHGRIDNAYSKSGTTFFQLNDGSGKIKGVLFNASEAEKELLRKNKFVKITGKVQLYEGSLEIIAEKIE